MNPPFPCYSALILWSDLLPFAFILALRKSSQEKKKSKSVHFRENLLPAIPSHFLSKQINSPERTDCTLALLGSTCSKEHVQPYRVKELWPAFPSLASPLLPSPLSQISTRLPWLLSCPLPRVFRVFRVSTHVSLPAAPPTCPLSIYLLHLLCHLL